MYTVRAHKGRQTLTTIGPSMDEIETWAAWEELKTEYAEEGVTIDILDGTDNRVIATHTNR